MKTQDIKLFIQVVDSGSIVKAAGLLDLPKSNVSRRIQALEHFLGAKLFVRQPRALQLTEQGQVFYDNAISMLQQFDDTINAIKFPKQQVSGHLKVQLAASAHSHAINDLVYRFMASHPQVTVEILSSNDTTSIIAKHVDVGFHYGESLPDSEMIARKLKTAQLSLYASSEFLAKHNLPSHIEQLAELPYIQARMPGGELLRMPLTSKFKPQNMRTVFTSNDVGAILNAAIAGVGIVALPVHIGDAMVKLGSLKCVYASTPVYEVHSWLLYRSNQFMPLLQRRFIDFIVAEFANMDLAQAAQTGVSKMVNSE
ncbi:MULTISPECIES: LysR family transcriptional regulator [Shewanella]|uniref:LysR family transcriptional regulator n=1 Tax=Shewanella TaxID=22 RepID=UPI00049186FC|nr:MULTISPECIES: LysR family transcriptional regulator [Shewanella]QLE86261.1 LysR family transcriptional regulator [Shewanella sp. Scap07]